MIKTDQCMNRANTRRIYRGRERQSLRRRHRGRHDTARYPFLSWDPAPATPRDVFRCRSTLLQILTLFWTLDVAAL